MNAVPSARPRASHSRATAALVVAAIGVVFGDIGTSPLYAFKEAFGPRYGIALARDNVLGILSLMTWSLVWVITVKYLFVILRADNNGEGGILSLLALALRGLRRGRLRATVVVLGVLGAAMFYGDSMITPAITVLSAMEGLQQYSPELGPYVVPFTLAVVTALFAVQRHGTATVGLFFGPVMVLWFLTLAALGVAHIARHPAVLAGLLPEHAVHFAFAHPLASFLVLGAVFLVLTGGESIYTDMGHFGKRPIRIAWLGLAFPALLLNYFGQGALVLADPAAAAHPFFRMVPGWATLPMVVLATCASVIASQAVISGAFSVTRQAIQLGYVPRLEILHTSERAIGQVYVPFVNWVMFVAVALLVLGFQGSSSLASAYGVAVTTTMAIDTLLAMVVAVTLWRWPRPLVALTLGSMLLVDLLFFATNASKIPSGGWFPLLAGGAIFTLLTTWKRGRTAMLRRLSEQGIPLAPFLEGLREDPPQVVAGTAVFMTAAPDAVPHALLHNLKHNKVLHERTVFLTVVTHDVPFVPVEDRVQLVPLVEGFHQVEAWYGFKEQPDIHEILDACGARYGLAFDMMETSFFLSRDTVIPVAGKPGAALWRDHLFAWMSRNATRATEFFNIPANRVVELGTHVEI